jgi:hypothetical protein
VMPTKVLATVVALAAITACASDSPPEIARFPFDAVVAKGPGSISADVDECHIEMTLEADEVLASSAATDEAVFYRPTGEFSVKSAPYLYKPDVERHSDITWNYRKPRPVTEPWFGMRCAITDPPDLSEPYFSMNCPAVQEGAGWQVDEAYKTAIPNAKLESIKGEGWTGFLISWPEKQNAHMLNLTFCLLGKSSLLMGQSRLSVSAGSELDVVRRAIGSIRLLGRRQ